MRRRAIAYHAQGTGIVTPTGTIATPLTTAPETGSAGPVDGRFVVATGRSTDPQTGAVGTIYHLVDQAGNATRVGGVYPQLDHGTTVIGNGFAAMTLDYTPTTDAPMALLNLRTGQEFHHERHAYQAVQLFRPAPGGVPFTAYTGKKGASRTVMKWNADGSIRRLFRLPKHRAVQYVDITRNLVVSIGKHHRTLVSTVRKPAKVRWSTPFTQVRPSAPAASASCWHEARRQSTCADSGTASCCTATRSPRASTARPRSRTTARSCWGPQRAATRPTC